VLVTTNNGPARLLRNSAGKNNWLRIRAVGTISNRDAIGTLVRVTPAGGRPSPWALVKTGSSYCSQSEMPLTFGLGTVDRVDKIEVKWPNGRTQTLPGTRANQTLTVEEPRSPATSASR
jgi:hypothetical protein